VGEWYAKLSLHCVPLLRASSVTSSIRFGEYYKSGYLTVKGFNSITYGKAKESGPQQAHAKAMKPHNLPYTMHNAPFDDTCFGSLGYEQRGESLLPGLPNEAVLAILAQQFLVWSTLKILVGVNSGWREAIRSRQVITTNWCA
jgi:hypothetical protein